MFKVLSQVINYEDIHNSWLYCFTSPLEIGTRVSLSHHQPAKHVSQFLED